jgi:hypothetical protein
MDAVKLRSELKYHSHSQKSYQAQKLRKLIHFYQVKTRRDLYCIFRRFYDYLSDLHASINSWHSERSSTANVNWNYDTLTRRVINRDINMYNTIWHWARCQDCYSTGHVGIDTQINGLYLAITDYLVHL